METVFAFFVILALATIAVLEGLKVILDATKWTRPPWLMVVFTMIIAEAFGILAAIVGVFNAPFGLSTPSRAAEVALGVIVGAVAFAITKFAYDLCIKLLLAVVQWLVSLFERLAAGGSKTPIGGPEAGLGEARAVFPTSGTLKSLEKAGEGSADGVKTPTGGPEAGLGEARPDFPALGVPEGSGK